MVDAEDITAAALSLAAGELLRQRLVKTIAVPAPAAGAEWSVAVPGQVVWELLAVNCVLTTSAVVANRNASVAVADNQGSRFGRFVNAAVVVAASASSSTWAAGIGVFSGTGTVTAPLPSPPLVVPAGGTVSSVTANLDVGDAYSSIVLEVREWNIVEIVQAADWIGERLHR